MLRPKIPLILTLLALALPACPGTNTYCQSGPKHGTQCYDVNEPDPSTDPNAPPPDHQQRQLTPH